MREIMVNTETANKLGINTTDLEKIKLILGRMPNFAELCLYSVLLNSKSRSTGFDEITKIIQKDRKKNENPVPPNQSFIRLNEQLSCFLKIESNDLPLTSGPYSESTFCLVSAGRNVIASGATPAAILNTFRFGLPELKITKKIADEFRKGVGEIGNSSGYPVVGAKINFEKCFNDRPELNTLVVGLIENSKINHHTNKFVNQKIYIVSDEINPEFFINEEITSKTDLDTIITKMTLSTISGLAEKKLHESTIEALETGAIINIKAIGKNGLLPAIIEFISDHQCGININFEKVLPPVGLEKFIGALFSSQFANFLLIVEKGKEKLIEKIYNKWELNFKEIGEICETSSVTLNYGNKTLAVLPLELGVPEIDLPNFNTKESSKPQKNKLELADIPMPENLKNVAWFLIKHPNIASKKWLNEEYDTMAGISNMSTNFTSDAVLINIKATDNALALCMTGNQKHLRANPSVGAQIAVAAAVRKIVCSGAKPLAIIPSINFLNIDKPEDCSILSHYLNGLKEASEKLKLPIQNENIKFNINTDIQNRSASFCPSITVGMIGILENKNKQMTISFKNKGNIIFLIGPSKDDVSASEYLVSYHNKEIHYHPFFDIELELKLQKAIQELIQNNLVCSAHNISRGGLFISLVESAMHHGYGFDIITDTDIRLDAFLFGESQGRVLVSINPNKETSFIDFMMKKEIHFLALGHVTKGEMRIDDISYGFIEDARRAYENALEDIITK